MGSAFHRAPRAGGFSEPDGSRGTKPIVIRARRRTASCRPPGGAERTQFGGTAAGVDSRRGGCLDLAGSRVASPKGRARALPISRNPVDPPIFRMFPGVPRPMLRPFAAASLGLTLACSTLFAADPEPAEGEAGRADRGRPDAQGEDRRGPHARSASTGRRSADNLRSLDRQDGQGQGRQGRQGAGPPAPQPVDRPGQGVRAAPGDRRLPRLGQEGVCRAGDGRQRRLPRGHRRRRDRHARERLADAQGDRPPRSPSTRSCSTRSACRPRRSRSASSRGPASPSPGPR